jgi:hypothetical protein
LWEQRWLVVAGRNHLGRTSARQNKDESVLRYLALPHNQGVGATSELSRLHASLPRITAFDPPEQYKQPFGQAGAVCTHLDRSQSKQLILA